MLCNYINQIYIEHIGPNLMADEFTYNYYIREHILDLWNDCTHIAEKVVSPDPKSVYFLKNDTIQFKITIYFDSIFITTYDEPICSLSIIFGLSKQIAVKLFLTVIRTNIQHVIQKTIGNVNVNFDRIRNSYYDRSYLEDYNVSLNPNFIVKPIV
jgi:hypothetical protein